MQHYCDVPAWVFGDPQVLTSAVVTPAVKNDETL